MDWQPSIFGFMGFWGFGVLEEFRSHLIFPEKILEEV